MDEDLTESGYKPRPNKKLKGKRIKRQRAGTMQQVRKMSQLTLTKQKKLSQTPYFVKSDEVRYRDSASEPSPFSDVMLIDPIHSDDDSVEVCAYEGPDP